MVRTSADNLLNIINDILDFSKIEAGKLRLENINFELRDVIEEALGLLADKAHGKQLEVTYSIAPNAPVAVRGDPVRLRQVLVNLLSNAVKFTNAGAIAVRVDQDDETLSRIHRAVSGQKPKIAQELDLPVRLVFEVEDTGMGIAREDQDLLFTAFSQVDASTTRRFGGTGLGLAICKRLVTLMGGDIEVTSQPGVGSTFRFSIQVLLRTAKDSTPPGILKDRRALIVDNHACISSMIAQQLQVLGMVSEQALSGSDALSLLDASLGNGRPISCIIAATDLADMSRSQLVTDIRRDPRYQGMRFLSLTTLRDHVATPADAVQLGIDAQVMKPLRLAQLREVLLRFFHPIRESTTERRRNSGAYPSLKGRILLADDNAINQRLVVALISRMGCRCDVVGNGLEALQALAQAPYDLVLMDCNMPEMDGFLATVEIRATEARTGAKRIPVIAVTANAMSGDREECLAAGMDDYLAKPIRLEALRDLLTRWLPGLSPE
jgi:CheY-like chemotaxis protein